MLVFGLYSSRLYILLTLGCLAVKEGKGIRVAREPKPCCQNILLSALTL